MPGENLNILYLCADRGITIDGTKGASAHIREFASALIRAGHLVTVVTRGEGFAAPVPQPFRSVILPQNPSGLTFDIDSGTGINKEAAADSAEYGQNPYIEDRLLELDSGSGFDVLYERYSLYSVAGLNYARAKGIPFILEVNAPLVQEALRYRRLGLPGLAKTLERHLFSKADSVVAVSRQLADYISMVSPGSNVAVIPNGVDFERFSRCGSSGSIPRGFTVGFVGNVRPWHGVDILMRAFAAMWERDRSSRLMIVGDIGKMKSRLEKLKSDLSLKDSVMFVGAVPHESVPGLLSEMDVAVAPYPEIPDFYFSSLKVFEYMAAGLPILTSRIGQIQEILEDGRTALLLPPGDVGALADALARLRDHRGLRQALGEAARLEAKAKHTWEKRLETITALMRSQPRSPGKAAFHED
jgi:glycosyltransferase involved in cell wall biosynthesis